MIYGARGETQKAAETFRLYYQLCKTFQMPQQDPGTIQRHLEYLDELAIKLGIAME